MGKKIKSVFKKAINPIAALKQDTPEMPAAPDVTPAAAPVEAPKQDQTAADTAAATESDRKKARSGGKKSLSVSRSSGGGLNI